MTKVDKIKEYMEICGVNQKEVAETKTYTKSKPWLCKVLSESVPMPQDEYEMIMKACSEARANKSRKNEKIGEN